MTPIELAIYASAIRWHCVATCLELARYLRAGLVERELLKEVCELHMNFIALAGPEWN